jgi:hypothetical protein
MSSLEALPVPTPMPASIIGSLANPSSASFVETGFASTSFLIVCSALVMLMTPGVGLLYVRPSNAVGSLTFQKCIEPYIPQCAVLLGRINPMDAVRILARVQ